MLSIPAGTNAELLKKAVREFAHVELAGYRYVMVLHKHQANPHVHLNVKAEAIFGKRLNPRKVDLHRWRETFAEKLRGWGIDAEATRRQPGARTETTSLYGDSRRGRKRVYVRSVLLPKRSRRHCAAVWMQWSAGPRA